MIAFACPGCGKPLKVGDELAGKRGKCPSCGQRTRIPQAPVPAGANGGAITVETAPGIAQAVRQTSDNSSGSRRVRRVTREDYSFLAPAKSSNELGRLGHYRILKVLGTGGMGIVFEAEDTQLERHVALKAMKPAVLTPENRERFLHEARATAAIEHDHIVTIYQVGEDCGVPFLAMKLLQGQSLEERLTEEGGWLPVAEVLRIGRETAEGLAAAHAKGLIHRDIKPANIWLEQDRGRVKIVDFGLARAAETDMNLTQEGLVMGTPAYMAPEQADDKPLDHRCDLFSLGCVLYRAATGQMAFKGKDSMSIMMALATKTPDAPRDIDPGLPAAFSDLIMQLLAKDPDERPANSNAVRDSLVEIERSLSAATAARTTHASRSEEMDLKPTNDEVDLKPDSDDEVVVLEVDAASAAVEAVAEAEEVPEVEEAEEVHRRRKKPTSLSGPRAKKRRETPDEAEGSERIVIIIGVVAAGLIILLLAFLFLRRALRSDEPTSGQSPPSGAFQVARTGETARDGRDG